MICSSLYLLYFMSVIFLVDELPGNYAGMAGRGQVREDDVNGLRCPVLLQGN